MGKERMKMVRERRNGSWEESKRDLLEESIVESIVAIEE
jgi:hypothetical protein